ncbi:hypothetical protein H6P81_014596 [Aristolochia fimbriata]|uniref:Nuclear speckle splicing regulatory protein 1 N-terminal domain-containing protein n=1 Tax=Aristolochia fimbriata TaxID=158543 RepID=A0AAV7E4C9_ARIFI|nr:hypothetical protein H6P81_014596 [Aristolochia fimbriata]
MKKYGLQLRVPVSQKKQNPNHPPLPPPEIARQAYKNKALKVVEEQHKKALEEDPSVFDYDGVYDDMKQKMAQPLMKDRQERKSKYIEKLMAKARVREREHEIVYERKLAKERSKDDHLFAEKEKFVTSAYKKKLAEQAEWLEEERLRQLREEKEDLCSNFTIHSIFIRSIMFLIFLLKKLGSLLLHVTKKEDLSDFYFNLSKNVAFGGGRKDREKSLKEIEATVSDDKINQGLPATGTDQQLRTSEPSQVGGGHHDEPKNLLDIKNLQDEAASTSTEGSDPETANPVVAEEKKEDGHKLSEDALAAAKERYLARKKAKLL